MQIFTLHEAAHYCGSFNGLAGDPAGSIDAFHQNHVGNRQRSMSEGTALFAGFRDCSLRDVERSLFFAASMYRRSLDMMLASSASWAHVTLYYGAWYASRAILGMFGCTIFYHSVVDVGSGASGQQALRVRAIRPSRGQKLTIHGGSHKAYWDLFYQATRSLRALVGSARAAALTPVGNDSLWLINNRNSVNYDTLSGLQLTGAFQAAFSPANFPGSLPGQLGTQYRISEGLIEVAFDLAGRVGLSTDALGGISNLARRGETVADLVYHKKPPGLVRLTKKSAVTK